MSDNIADQHHVRIQKLQALREAGIEPFAYRFAKTHNTQQLLANFDAMVASGESVSLAGRLNDDQGHGQVSVRSHAG